MGNDRTGRGVHLNDSHGVRKPSATVRSPASRSIRIPLLFSDAPTTSYRSLAARGTSKSGLRATHPWIHESPPERARPVADSKSICESHGRGKHDPSSRRSDRDRIIESSNELSFRLLTM